MLRSKQAVSRLNFNRSTHPNVHTAQLPLLESLYVELLAARGKLDFQEVEVSKRKMQRAQLLKCAANLITALVMKLEMFEIVCTTRRDQSGRNSKSNSQVTISKAENAVVHILWLMLYAASTQALRDQPWKYPSGDPAHYGPIRQAIHCLMGIVLCVTRNNSEAWSFLENFNGPEAMHDQVSGMLSLPGIYLSSMSAWPAPDIMNELSALPSEFISLFCCLQLEQLDDKSATCAAMTSTPAAAIAATSTDFQLESGSRSSIQCRTNSNLLFTALLGNLLSIVRNANGEVMFKFVTPAVIQLCKRSLLLCHNVAGIPGCSQSNTIAYLQYLLMKSNQLNKTAATCTMKSFLQSCEALGTHLLPLYRPNVISSDLQLLHKLLTDRYSEEGQVELQYELVTQLLMSWTTEASEFTPFPSPSKADHICAVQLVMQFCASETAAWMRLLRRLGCDAGDTLGANPLNHRALSSSLPQMLAAAQESNRLLARWADMEQGHGRFCSGARSACLYFH